jgi:hypothetical protein
VKFKDIPISLENSTVPLDAEVAVEYLYGGEGELVSLEEKTSKIAKGIMLNRIRSKKEIRIRR